MTMSKLMGILFMAACVSFVALGLGERLSIPSFTSVAEARVGRPLTPVSAAGVARRTVRRCAAGAYDCY
jgi:hypothetical protein